MKTTNLYEKLLMLNSIKRTELPWRNLLQAKPLLILHVLLSSRILYHKKTILSIPLKYTPEEARAAIEWVKSGEGTEAPKVKEYEAMTHGQIKKFIADFSKNKRYSKKTCTYV